MGAQTYSFGRFRVIPEERLLLRDLEPVPVTPKVFDTLVLLLEKRGRLVAKDELLQALWPGTFVDENNLNKNISILRKALDDGDNGGRLIETVPKMGYRFIGAVNSGSTPEIERSESPPNALPIAPPEAHHSLRSIGWISLLGIAAAVVLTIALRPGARKPVAVRQIRSLAVLPFRRLDATTGPNYLGLALADALIDRLGYAKRFSIRPLSSSQRFADGKKDAIAAGMELDVDAVVEGAVQVSGKRTRVTVELINVAERAPMWSAKFDEASDDVFALEDLVGGAVARALMADVTATAAPPPRHHPPADAYDDYVRGRYYLSQRSPADVEKALQSFQTAVELDRDFAAGYAGVAESCVLTSLYRIRPPAVAFPLAKAAALRALELDPSLAEAHGCLGATSFYYDRDSVNAETELRRAIALKPAYDTGRRWYANYLTSRGRFDESIREIKAAQSFDPQSLMLRAVLGWQLFMARRYDQAIAQLQQTLDIDNDFVPAIHTLALAYMETNRDDRALALFEREAVLAGPEYMVADMARLHALRGRREEARQWLARAEKLAAEDKVMRYDLAGVYGALGDVPRAIASLRDSLEAHESGLVWMTVDPRLDSLRARPEFSEIVRRSKW